MLFNPRDGKSEREHGDDCREIYEIKIRSVSSLNAGK